MTSRTATGIRADNDTSRYWLLVHAGKVHHVNWNDGERLLSLSTAVLAGVSEPQTFTFLPRGASTGSDSVTLFLRPDEPIDLITEYEHASGAMQSHWFG
jgi:hypothetical protein